MRQYVHQHLQDRSTVTKTQKQTILERFFFASCSACCARERTQKWRQMGYSNISSTIIQVLVKMNKCVKYCFKGNFPHTSLCLIYTNMPHYSLLIHFKLKLFTKKIVLLRFSSHMRLHTHTNGMFNGIISVHIFSVGEWGSGLGFCFHSHNICLWCNDALKKH